MFDDSTFWIYCVLIVISFYGFLLFSWWWWTMKRASSTFIYITILLFGTGFRTIGDLIRLYYYYYNTDQFKVMGDCILWDLRLLPTLIGTILIVSHMSYRAFWERKTK